MLVFYEIFIDEPGANLCIIASSLEWTLRSELYTALHACTHLLELPLHKDALHAMI